MKYFTPIAICVLLITSCNQSELSTQKVNDISLIAADITIYQDHFDKKKNTVAIQLSDKKGDVIRNDSIVIFVNNIRVKITHKQGLYYTEESYYYLSDVPVNDNYTAEIKLYNGKKQVLGTVKALQQESIDNIDCDEKGDLNKNTVVKWKNLKDIDRLEISTSMRAKIETDSNTTTVSEMAPAIKKIARYGSYVFLKKDYADSASSINLLTFDFQTTKVGKTNPKLLEKSKITISTSMSKTINFEKN